MNNEVFLIRIVGIVIAIILMEFLLRFLKLPSVIGYILIGILIGPSGLKIITDIELITMFGSLGVVFLLFFVGMEISFKNILETWRFALFGTVLQVIASVAAVYILGLFLGWSINRVVLLGFIISLSSTAVVIKILKDLREEDKKISRNVISILLFQDLIIVPMIIVLNILGGQEVSFYKIGFQLLSGFLLITFIIYLVSSQKVNLNFLKYFKDDGDLQIYFSILFCFGFAILTSFFGLSTALGAFIAGILISVSKGAEWIKHTLTPFYVIFVGLFFISIGMLLNLNFLLEHFFTIFMILILAFLVNTLINAFVFKLDGNNMQESLYGGALVSQLGEFSFVLAAMGLQMGIITTYSYDMTLSIIALSLLFSPFYVLLFKKYSKKYIKYKKNAMFRYSRN